MNVFDNPLNLGWIGVDLDGTLAQYDVWRGGHVGDPIDGPVLEYVRMLVREGADVRIFTARAACQGSELEEQVTAIQAWTAKHLGKVLPVTCVKDMHMLFMIDDRAYRAYKGYFDTTVPPGVDPRWSIR